MVFASSLQIRCDQGAPSSNPTKSSSARSASSFSATPGAVLDQGHGFLTVSPGGVLVVMAITVEPLACIFNPWSEELIPGGTCAGDCSSFFQTLLVQITYNKRKVVGQEYFSSLALSDVVEYWHPMVLDVASARFPKWQLNVEIEASQQLLAEYINEINAAVYPGCMQQTPRMWHLRRATA